MSATCTCAEPCPTMCAQAGSNLGCIIDDLSNLIQPFVPAINKKIAGSGQPNTVAGKLGNFSNQQMLLLGGIVVVIALVVLHHS